MMTNTTFTAIKKFFIRIINRLFIKVEKIVTFFTIITFFYLSIN